MFWLGKYTREGFPSHHRNIPLIQSEKFRFFFITKKEKKLFSYFCPDSKFIQFSKYNVKSWHVYIKMIQPITFGSHSNRFSLNRKSWGWISMFFNVLQYQVYTYSYILINSSFLHLLVFWFIVSQMRIGIWSTLFNWSWYNTSF